jgi:UDP-glucose 4-epimerase
MKEKYLVTGGAGFIGSNLVRFLLERGQEVVVLDDLSSGKRENIDSLLVVGQCRLIVGDIRDPDVVPQAMRDCRAVFHLAAIGSVPRSVTDPVTSFDVNVRGTANILECAKVCGIKRIVFASSGSVYGGVGNTPLSESTPVAPASPYAASKAAGEAYFKAYAQSYGMETVPLRYFNVYGPRQNWKRLYPPVIPTFVQSILAGKSPIVYGTGNQTRDFCHVENICHANWLAAHIPPEQCDGSPVNIGCGVSHTVNDILEYLKGQFSQNIGAEYQPARPGDVEHSVSNIALARQKLGYEPRVEFVEGVKTTVAWYIETISETNGDGGV